VKNNNSNIKNKMLDTSQIMDLQIHPNLVNLKKDEITNQIKLEKFEENPNKEY